MTNTFYMPTSTELTQIAQDKLPRLSQDRAIFDIFRIRDVDQPLVSWEQRDNFIGLMTGRGFNGEPGTVQRVGGHRYNMQPGVYGDKIVIPEQELLLRRQWGTFNTPININDLVMEGQDQLLEVALDRIEWVCWTLLVSGTFSVFNNNVLVHSDSYTNQTYSAPVVWSTTATSGPLADFRAVKLLSRGHSVNFGRKAVAYMNQTTFNYMISNTNNSDLFGRRNAGLATINNLADLNTLFLGDDLPQIQVYDETYFDNSGSLQLFIPTGKVIVNGARPANSQVAEFQFTRNAQNVDMAPGLYNKIFDRRENDVPGGLEIHTGFNGGPAIMFPSSIVTMIVA
jgi:hypothetical protein